MTDRARLSRHELREATLTGVRWTLVARVVAQLLGIAAMVLLARLVPPVEFGYAVIAIVANTFAVTVVYDFVGVPLVQAESIERSQLATATLASLALGTLLCAATFLFGATVAVSLFDERTATLVALVAPAFVLGSVAAVPRAMLHRRLDFAGVSKIEVASLVAGHLTAVTLALAGVDAEALVVGVLVTTAVATLLVALRAPLPLPRWQRGGLRKLASFGMASGLSAVTAVGFRNVDFAIIGARLNAVQLGYYWRAFQLGVEHQGKISTIMMRVALPLYSRAANIEDMRRLRRRITRAHATVILPLQAGLIGLAPVLIPWVLGAPWEPAVVPTQILAVAGMLTAVLTGVSPLVLAVGRPRALLAYNVASAVLYAAAIFLVAPYGLTAVCGAVVAVYAVQFACAQVLLLERLVGIPVRELAHDAGPAAVSSATLLVTTLAVVQVTEAASLPAPMVLALGGALGACAYLLTLRAGFTEAWADLALLGRLVMRKDRARAQETEPVALGRAPVSAG